MEKPADQADPLAVVNTVNVESPERKVVRRRLVQSTLFPLKPHEPKIEDSAKQEAKKVEEIADDEEECCGSQGKSRKRANRKGAKKVEVIIDDLDNDDDCCGSQGRTRKGGTKSKRNATPQKRSSKKVAVNEKDASIIEVDDIESPDEGSPQQLKDKQRASVRNGRTRGKKGSFSAKVSTQPVASHQASQPVPDLWLEAKRTAEENSRLFSGKQVHPFFSAWKGGKKDQETTEVEKNGCLDRRKERHAEFRPIHVFENNQVEMESTDWSNWTLCEGTFGHATCDQERAISSFEGTFDSSNGTDLNISKPSGLSLHLEDMSMGHHHGAEDTCAIPTFDSPVIVDEEVSPYDLLKNMEKDFEMNKFGFITGDINEQQKAIFLESIMSYYLNRGNNPANSLWTNKYQPEKALEVCGNGEAVKFINEWLHLWHSTDFHVSRRSSRANKCLMREDDDSYDYDSDVENVDEASGLKNVLLVTGPVGSGKSAAIYACAKEQGFQVIEVNASDWRNGALLKQKFGEALGSHSLKRSQEYPAGSPNKLKLKSSPAVFTNKAAALDLNKSVFEVVSLSEEEDSVDGMQCARDGRIPCDYSEIKTVILFEDVDATLCEDRGFISTIQQLAETGKRPMILTSNSENPPLPDSLAREEVCFTMPSLKELMYHIYLVCAAEKANVQPCLIERCIHFCGGDIRKTLMHLQFWCQSKGFVKDGKMRTMYSPLMFNLEAGHCVLPRLIPWELPSSLSVFIEAEIANTLCKISMEENNFLLEVIEEEADCIFSENNLDFERGETASIEAKKEAILRGNCFQHVENDTIAVSSMFDFSDSPVAFARRNVRRKLGTVLSDSEDEIPDVSVGLVGGDNNSSVPTNEFFPIPCPTMNDTCNAPDSQLPHTGMVEEPKLPSETSHLNQIDFSFVGNSHKSTGQCVDHAEANCAEFKEHHVELADVNYNNKDSADRSLNLLADPLPHPVEAKFEANGNLFPVAGQVNQNSPAISNLRNQSTDHAIQFMEENTIERELGNADHCEQDVANYSVNPLSDCGESKMAVKRCLFPQALHVDPIYCTVDTPLNQSTDQLVNQGSQEAAHYSGNSLIAEFLSLGEANLENIKSKHPEIVNVNPFGSVAVDNSLNQSTDQMFHSVEDKQLEFQNLFPGTGTTSHINCAPVGDSSNQWCNQFLGIAKLEEIQEQPPESADVKHWKTMTHQSPFEENKIENVEHQLPAITGVDVECCPVVGNSMNPVNGKLLHFEEENQSQYSEATNLNHVNGCQSLDMSCVPESTFVPETEVNDGMEFPSGDFMEIVSPVSAGNFNPSLKHKISRHIERCSDINLNVSYEEMGDSQSENEHMEASTSGCQVMDECSRMDFCKRSKSFRRSRLAAKNPVHEKWNELRQTDLKQHFTSEHKHARQILELAYGMSSLISEADLLLHPCRFLTNDSLDQEICPGEETLNFGWYDQQVQMASAIAEHGYCLYAKSIDSLQLKTGIDNKVQLAWELLASTSDSMALGKLLRLGSSKTQTFLSDGSLKGAAPTVDISLKREREMCLQNMVQSIVPFKSHLALRGDALHDYLSSLAHISSSEASRMAEAAGKRKGRRVRVAKNYLTSGGLDLSSDDITLLNTYNSYGKG